MYNPEEAAIETKKYLKKLKSIIENEASLTLLKTKVVSKSRLDDALCCVEASFTQEYKDYIKKAGPRALKSYVSYMSLQASIKRKFIFSSSHYSVLHGKALILIDSIQKSIAYDYKHACNSY